MGWNGFRGQHMVGYAVALKDHGGPKAVARPVAAAAASQVQETVRAGSGRVAAFVGAPPARTALRPAQGKLEGMLPPGSASLPAHRKVIQVACMQIQAIFDTKLGDI